VEKTKIYVANSLRATRWLEYIVYLLSIGKKRSSIKSTFLTIVQEAHNEES
jgi:hypothetical protein